MEARRARQHPRGHASGRGTCGSGALMLLSTHVLLHLGCVMVWIAKRACMNVWMHMLQLLGSA